MNVIGSRPDGWWRDRRAAQARLVERLTRQPGRPRDVVVVFDGDAPAGSPETLSVGSGAVGVVFAGSGRPDAADDVIVDMVRGHARPAELVVVTSDRGLAARVRQLGADRCPVAQVDGWDEDPGPDGRPA